MSGTVFGAFYDVVRRIPADTFAPGTQRALLEAEGVAFRLDGTVDLEQCLWTPES